jgi:hypothetical protein
MSEDSIYLLAADVILITHVLFVAFVVLGLVAIYIGSWLSWGWVRNFRFRILHLSGIAIVVVESWTGMACPLTNWEMQLRKQAGLAAYNESFIQHWLHTILYFQAAEWVFIVCYTVFGGLVVASWFIVRPK